MIEEIAPFEMCHYPAARALWEQTPGIGLGEDDEPDAIARFLARNPGSSLVARVDGSLAGTILVGHDGRRGLIHHLAVTQRSRRHGIATRLVREGIHRLQAAGIRKCHLLVFASNSAGRAFWSAVGAEHRDTLVIYSLGVAAQGRST